MPLPRTQFESGIIAEFLPPKGFSNKLIILLDGMPSVPAKNSLVRFLADKGYWVVHMRYRGTWESKGVFLKESPDKDIISVLDEIEKNGLTSVWDGNVYKPVPNQVILLGASFAGPAMFLASKDKRIHKIVAFSPVVDWRSESKIEPLDYLERFVAMGFGNAYRFDSDAWQKIAQGTFYNPATNSDCIDGKKIMIIHAKNDEIVLPKPVENFAKKVRAKLIMKKKGGHLSSSNSMRFFWWHNISFFLKT